MHGTGTEAAWTSALRTARSAWTRRHAGTAHHRLAGADRSAVKRLTGNGTGRWSRGQPGARLLRRRRLSRHGFHLLLLQTGYQVGARRDHGTRGGLTGKIGTHLLTQRHTRRRRHLGTYMGRAGVRRAGMGSATVGSANRRRRRRGRSGSRTWPD